MFRELPDEPTVPAAQRGEGELPLRYEDIVADGRLTLEPVLHAVGASIWRSALVSHPFAIALMQDGVIPILARLRIEGGGGPVAVRQPASCRGTFEIVRAIDESGATRFRMDAWAELGAPRGRTHGPPPDGAGEPIVLGRAVAEHVLTRPFAPASERKVSSLVLPPGMDARQVSWSPPRSVLELPPGAVPLGPVAMDPAPIAFGAGHTDSNQHVNSLVYPRLFEEALLRRLAALGRPTALLARFVELGYRKPSFAGDVLRLHLEPYLRDGQPGAVGFFAAEGQGAAEARCYVRMELVP